MGAVTKKGVTLRLVLHNFSLTDTHSHSLIDVLALCLTLILNRVSFNPVHSRSPDHSPSNNLSLFPLVLAPPLASIIIISLSHRLNHSLSHRLNRSLSHSCTIYPIVIALAIASIIISPSRRLITIALALAVACIL